MAVNDEKTPGGVTPPEPKSNDAAETVESLKAKLEEQAGHITKLNEESKKHRLEAKEHKTSLDKATEREVALKKALGLGEKDPVDEKLAQLKLDADAKNSRVLLKAAVMAAVGDAHDPDAVWELAKGELKDVKVDLEAETVDGAALKSKLADIRKNKAFLFKPVGQGAGGKQPGGGAPGGSNHYTTWKQMMDNGQRKEAGAYYQQHRPAILAGSPK